MKTDQQYMNLKPTNPIATLITLLDESGQRLMIWFRFDDTGALESMSLNSEANGSVPNSRKYQIAPAKPRA
jgi:hypothetical protein